MQVIDLHPQIRLYRGVLEDPSTIIQKARNSDGWYGWHVFGEIKSFQLEGLRFDEFPSQHAWEEAVSEEPFLKDDGGIEVLSAFYRVTSDYLKNNPLDLENWKCNSPSIGMYETNGGASDYYAMQYHTDYQKEKEHQPGDKHALTCTMYLNDDYEGGEICFKIDNGDSTFLELEHKPVAGDILVFPAKAPFFHSVKLVTTGKKYIVRSFWQYEYPGHPEWLANKEKYGEELWAQMELERQKTEQKEAFFKEPREDK